MTDDEIRTLLKAATPGPWKAKRAPHGPIDIFDHREMDVVTVYGGAVELEHKAGNARLIAAAPDAFAEVLRLREALREIADQASLPQQFYDRNGPTWTGKDGHEYEDTSAHLERCNELESIARAALKGAAE